MKSSRSNTMHAPVVLAPMPTLRKPIEKKVDLTVRLANWRKEKKRFTESYAEHNKRLGKLEKEKVFAELKELTHQERAIINDRADKLEKEHEHLKKWLAVLNEKHRELCAEIVQSNFEKSATKEKTDKLSESVEVIKPAPLVTRVISPRPVSAIVTRENERSVTPPSAGKELVGESIFVTDLVAEITPSQLSRKAYNANKYVVPPNTPVSQAERGFFSMGASKQDEKKTREIIPKPKPLNPRRATK